MNNKIDINPGEIKITFSERQTGKVSFNELGLNDNDLILENGLLRFVIELNNIANHHYYKVPTIEVSYIEEMGETHWQCDFNGEMILDKLDHHGKSTVILLNRNKLSDLEHRHENTLVVHAEFPQPAHLIAAASYIHLF